MTKRTYLSRAIEPLLATARRMDWPERQAWLDDLRTDAPTLIAEVERILARRSADASPTADATPPAGFLAFCAQHLRLSPRRTQSHRLTWHT
jgi:hypothetical protein